MKCFWYDGRANIKKGWSILSNTGGSAVKNPPAMQEPQEMWVQSLGWEIP